MLGAEEAPARGSGPGFAALGDHAGTAGRGEGTDAGTDTGGAGTPAGEAGRSAPAEPGNGHGAVGEVRRLDAYLEMQ